MKSNANGKHAPKLIYSGHNGILFQGDSLALLQHMEHDTVDLVFVDPPFNLGKDYGTDAFTDSLETEVYRSWCHGWLLELIKVLRPGGALFLYHLPKWLMELGHWMNTLPSLEYRSWIAIKMKGGFPIRNRLHPAHYGILYYTKYGAKPTFNVVRHRAPTCRHCGKEIRDYGGYRRKFEKYEDENGIPWIQVSDFWEDTRPARQDKVRELNIVEIPMHIPERAILMASNPGDVVLDIFGGSGSTYHAAQLHQRQWIGSDIADTTIILRRMKACFDLEAITEVDTSLQKQFNPEFLNPALEDYLRENRDKAAASLEPLNKTAGSFSNYASKSKVLGF